MNTKARLDPDRTAKPLTRLVAKVPAGERFMGSATHYETADGQRVALQPGPDCGPSELYGAMFDACAAIALNAGIREDATGRVWIGAWYVEIAAAGEVVFAVREHREVHTFQGAALLPRAIRLAVATAVRGHVDERMTNYVGEQRSRSSTSAGTPTTTAAKSTRCKWTLRARARTGPRGGH